MEPHKECSYPYGFAPTQNAIRNMYSVLLVLWDSMTEGVSADISIGGSCREGVFLRVLGPATAPMRIRRIATEGPPARYRDHRPINNHRLFGQPSGVRRHRLTAVASFSES